MNQRGSTSRQLEFSPTADALCRGLTLDFCGLQGSDRMYLYLPWPLPDIRPATTPLHYSLLLYQKLLHPIKSVEILPNNKLWLMRKDRRIAFYSSSRENNSQNALKLLQLYKWHNGLLWLSVRMCKLFFKMSWSEMVKKSSAGKNVCAHTGRPSLTHLHKRTHNWAEGGKQKRMWACENTRKMLVPKGLKAERKRDEESGGVTVVGGVGSPVCQQNWNPMSTHPVSNFTCQIV